MAQCVAVVLSIALVQASLGQSSGRTSVFETGREVFLAGDYPRAIGLLERAIENDDQSAEAHYLVAQAFLATGESGKARHAIRKARTLDASNLKYAVAELEILRGTTPRESSISLTDGRRIGLARLVLEQDPENAAALEELGVHHAMSYRWYANFDATKQPLGDGIADKARHEFETARLYFRHALTADPGRLTAYGELLRLLVEEGRWTEAAEIADDAVESMPDRSDPWLFRGLVAQLQHQSEQADYSFLRAIERMSDADRSLFLDVSTMLTDEERIELNQNPRDYADRYWAARDPFRLTTVNERRVDHLARMAYAQLWYGGSGQAGWETERGMIILRYGIPWSDSGFMGGHSRFNVLEYRDFEFVFEDQTRGGHYTMYSPKASASSSWTNDYVIQAAEMAISNPEQYHPKLLDTIDLLVETTVFKGEGDLTDVYIHVAAAPGKGDSVGPGAGLLGVFVVDSNGVELDRAVDSWSLATTETGTTGSPATLALRTGPRSAAVEVEFLSDDRSAAGRRSIRADWPLFTGDSMAVSDLLAASMIEDANPGSSAVDGRIVRSGYSIAPMPWARVAAGSDLLVYFELYGLTLDGEGKGAYRVDAILRPDRRSGFGGFLKQLFTPSDQTSVAVSIESSADDADEARFISVGLPRDASGRYQLAIEITDLSTGRRIARAQDLTIRDARSY
ncbi:MAG TPA: tetratricopeptide repeat protein [Rhodothermales bacterium]|nr:tetratricopeptide repeat protein [Rhodothermales bacterium]